MFRGDLNNPIPPFWNSYHATDRWESPGRKKARGYTIRRDHEIFDDLFGTILLLDFKRLDLITIEYRFCLNGLQTEGAMSMTKFLQALRGLILQVQIFS